jgi:APA family basic amino acid/polyamine antiporter
MKPDDAVLAPTAHPGSATALPAVGFQQRLGLFDATMLVAGSMIGSGIFIVSAEISRDVGSSGWLLLVWALTGLITIMGALSYGELAAMMPHAGGQYVYLREAYTPLFGFLYGWTLFLVIQTGTIAAVAVAFAKFTGVFFPAFGADPASGALVLLKVGDFTITAGQLLGVLMIALLTAINCLGVREGKWVQNLFTVAKTGALALLVVFGLTVAANPQVVQANFQDVWGGIYQTVKFDEVHALIPYAGLAAWMIVGGAMVGSLFSADAWNNVTFTAGEVRQPRRNLPLSLALGTGLVILLYFLANVAYVRALPIQGEGKSADRVRYLELMASRLDREGKQEKKEAAKILRKEKDDLLKQASTTERGIAYAKDDRVGTALMELVWPQFGVQAMAIAIMISTFGCTNGLILSGARLYYAMARDGLFFRSVGRLNRHGVPAAGLILQAVWASLLTFSGTYGQLLNYVIFAALLFYVLTVAGLFVLRRTRPDAERPYRAIGYPVMPALYVGLCAALMLAVLAVKWGDTRWGLLIVLTGIPVFFLWRWLRPAPSTEAP